jgi:hypothetical protein
MSYKVVLGYQDYRKPKRTIYNGLTLEEAQNICEDKESSWQTCTKKYLKRRTRERGPWFLMLYKE